MIDFLRGEKEYVSIFEEVRSRPDRAAQISHGGVFEMSTKSNELNVQITPDFRLTADDRNFIVKERRLVDPTLAPNWKARLAADPTLSSEPREVWEDAGYYGFTTNGLAAALDSVRVKQAAKNGAESLAELTAQLSSESARIITALSSGALRDFRVELAS